MSWRCAKDSPHHRIAKKFAPLGRAIACSLFDPRNSVRGTRIGVNRARAPGARSVIHRNQAPSRQGRDARNGFCVPKRDELKRSGAPEAQERPLANRQNWITTGPARFTPGNRTAGAARQTCDRGKAQNRTQQNRPATHRPEDTGRQPIRPPDMLPPDPDPPLYQGSMRVTHRRLVKPARRRSVSACRCVRITAPCHYSRIRCATGAKLRRCSGVTPRSRSACICAALP